MSDTFKSFRSKTIEPAKNLLHENPDVKTVLKKFIARKSELSDSGLVSLVVLASTGILKNESYSEELELFEFVENNKITEAGNKYINDEKNIDRLRKLIED